MKNTYKSNPENKFESYRIVIIDDDEGLCRLIQKNLQQAGFRTVTANNGEQALRIIRAAPREILLIDYKLPDISGKELVEKLKEKYGTTPNFIVMTGFGDEKIVVEMMKLGAQDYIVKESDFTALLHEKLKRNCAEIEKNKQLLTNQKMLHDAEQLAGAGGWLWFVKSDRWIMSDNWKAIHGCTDKTFATDDLLKIAHPDDAEKIKEAFDKTATNGDPYQIEHRIIRQDNGEVRFIKAFGKAEPDHNGHVEIISGVALDITEQKNAERELQKSEEKFRSIFENAALGIFRSTPEGRYEEVNESFARILGFDSPKKMIDEVTDISQLYKYSEDREKIKKAFAEKGYVEDYEIIANHPNKDTVWISVNAKQRKHPNGKVYYEGTVQDITEKKGAINKLKQSEEKYRNIFENIQDVFYEVTLDGVLLDVSTSVKNFSGGLYSRDGLIGQNMNLLYENPDERKVLLQELEKKGYVTDYEIKLKNKDGTRLDCSISSSVKHNEDGIPEKIVGSLRDITDRKKMELDLVKAKEQAEANERKLNQNLQHLENLNNSLVDAVFTVDPITRKIKYVNNAVKTVFGYSPKECIGQNTSFLYSDEESYISFGKKLKDTISNNQDFLKTVVRLRRKTGVVFQAELTTSLVKENGKIVDILSVIRDVSEKIRYQNELIEAKEKAEEKELKMIEAQAISHVGSWEYIVDTDTVTWSKELYNIFERSYDLPAPKYSEQAPFYTSESFAKLDEAHQNCIRHEIPYEIELDIITSTGTVKQIISKGNVKKDANNSVIGSYGTAQDITAQKRLESELIAAKEKAEESKKKLSESLIDLQMAQQIASIGNWQFDPEIGIPIWSDEVFNIYDRDKKNGPPHIDEYKKMYKPDQYETFYTAISKAIKNGTDYDIILNFESPKTGETKWIRAICHPDVRKKTSRGYFLRGTIQDISKQKETEFDLVKAKEKAEESDRLKSAFLTNMSHEIRTPMNGILGFTDLLKEPALTDEQLNQYIDIIQKSGDRMLNTVNDLIDISKIETGLVKVAMTQTNILHEIKALYAFFGPEAEQKGLKLNLALNLQEDEAHILTDKLKFNSILTNLIKNAIKYTDKGSVKIGCEKRDGRLLCYVKDTGIGIPNIRQQAIFNRFEQADIGDSRAFEGSGLGLAITKAYVEMLNGEIRVESEVEVGSTFYFSLPWKSTEPKNNKTNDAATDKADLKPIAKSKILIAEDDEVSFEHLSILLRKHARELVHAKNGEQAVEICRQHPDIDIILMDIKMPVLNGYEAAANIREFNKDVVIIAQTAYAMTGDREKAIEAGCNDYIAKPIHAETLLRKIEKHA